MSSLNFELANKALDLALSIEAASESELNALSQCLESNIKRKNLQRELRPILKDLQRMVDHRRVKF